MVSAVCVLLVKANVVPENAIVLLGQFKEDLILAGCGRNHQKHIPVMFQTVSGCAVMLKRVSAGVLSQPERCCVTS